MLLVRLRLGLLGAVCCFVSATPVRVGLFLLLSATLGLASVLPLLVVGPRPRAGSPPWGVHSETHKRRTWIHYRCGLWEDAVRPCARSVLVL